MSQKDKFIETLEKSIIKVTKGQDAFNIFESGSLPDALLAQDAQLISKLSERYTDPNLALHVKINAQEQAAAYCLYYLPINAFKILTILGKVCHVFAERAAPLHVLDFGCGPGTASLALSEIYHDAMRIDAVDQSNAMLSIAKSIMAEHQRQRSNITFNCSKRIPRLESPNYDLILAGNVICEMDSDLATMTIDSLYNRLKAGGLLVIVEPALQEPTRLLMRLRDTFLKRHPEAAVIFPCTHCDSCPMLANSDHDWCHGTLSWEKPRLVRHIDRLTGFNKHRLKYSALILGKELNTPSGYRVIQPASKTKLGKEAILCGRDFYGKAQLPKKVRHERNYPFERAKSFDLLEISNWNKKGSIDTKTEVDYKHSDCSK